MRECNHCKKLKPESEFPSKTKEGWLRQPCKKCHSLKSMNYYKTHKQERSQYHKKRRAKMPEYYRKKFSDWKNKIRLEVLSHYSKGRMKCACCKESEIKFLAIDHLNGGGRKECQKLGRRGISFYMWLKKNNYPKGYQILCHNCNLAKGFYGKCPHKL